MEAVLQRTPFFLAEYSIMNRRTKIFVKCRAFDVALMGDSQLTPTIVDLQVPSLGRHLSAILFHTDARFGAF